MWSAENQKLLISLSSTFKCAHFMNQFSCQHCPLFSVAFLPWEFSYDFTQWIQETVITAAKDYFWRLLAGMGAASIWKLISFCCTGETLVLGYGKHCLCCHTAGLRRSLVLLSRKTNYLLSTKKSFLKFSAWSREDSFILFFLVSGSIIYYTAKLIFRIVASCLSYKPGIYLCEWHDQNQAWLLLCFWLS